MELSNAQLEAAPAVVETADLSATLPQVGWPRLSRDGTLEGSLLAMTGRQRTLDSQGVVTSLSFAGRHVACGAGSPSIRSITERPSLAL